MKLFCENQFCDKNFLVRHEVTAVDDATPAPLDARVQYDGERFLVTRVVSIPTLKFRLIDGSQLNLCGDCVRRIAPMVQWPNWRAALAALKTEVAV